MNNEIFIENTVIAGITIEFVNLLLKKLHDYGGIIKLGYYDPANTLGIYKSNSKIGDGSYISLIGNIDKFYYVDSDFSEISDNRICLKYPDKWCGVDGLNISKFDSYKTSLFIDKWRNVILNFTIDLGDLGPEMDAKVRIYLGHCELCNFTNTKSVYNSKEIDEMLKLIVENQNEEKSNRYFDGNSNGCSNGRLRKQRYAREQLGQQLQHTEL